jgi:putative membrane protein
MLGDPFELLILPAINAGLNASSAALLVTGHSFIRRGKVAAHRACMVTAVFTSSLFLISYLYYHAHAGIIRFRGVGAIRPFYFVLLTSHTVLAASLLILVPVTLGFALAGRFERHRPVARWTYPIWLYVSVTGVLIYFMVYRWF